MWINTIKEFIDTKSINISQKLAIVIVTLGFLIFLNNIIGFSYNYQINNKISQMENLNKIITDQNIDSIGKSYAVELRKEVYNRRTITEQTYRYFSSLLEKRETVDKIESQQKSRISSNFFYHLTASGLYYLIGFILLPLIVIGTHKTSLVQRIAAAFLSGGIFVTVGLVIYFLCSLVPIFSNSTLVYNYIFNVSIQMLSFFYMVKLTNKHNVLN